MMHDAPCGLPEALFKVTHFHCFMGLLTRSEFVVEPLPPPQTSMMIRVMLGVHCSVPPPAGCSNFGCPHPR